MEATRFFMKGIVGAGYPLSPAAAQPQRYSVPAAQRTILRMPCDLDITQCANVWLTGGQVGMRLGLGLGIGLRRR